jgi:ribosomal protein RSM22 (predicted rRNA methylase)
MMQFPDDLQLALEQEFLSCQHDELCRAAQRLTRHYGESKNSAALFAEPASLLAYLAVRMPATFAAISCVLGECKPRWGDWLPRSMVDIGAGPGTGAWSAIEQFPSILSICNVEPSRPMAEMGRKLARQSSSSVLQRAQWIDPPNIPPADLVLLSYLIGEMNPAERFEILERLWQQSFQMFVVIEPGTPSGYRRILEVRDWALNKGAHLAAPCPHIQPCPIKTQSWCHFPARVNRSRLHKLLKGATLGFEDEKFSYLVFGKIPVKFPVGRVVENPKKNSGFVQIPLCSDGILKEIVVTRKDAHYKAARDTSYGDAWEILC